MKTQPAIDLKHKRIVILYMLYFGDMVSLSPFLHVLRKAAEGSHITLVADSRFQEAAAYSPYIDEVIPVDRKGLGLSGTWKLGKKIGKKKPDLLFVLHGTARTSLMALAMKPRYWLGEAGTRLDHFLMDREILVERRDCHAAEKYVKVLESMGVIDTGHPGMELFTCPAWEEAAARFFEARHIRRGDKLIGFSVGSSTPEKNWPACRFGKVADYFAGKGYIPVFFGVASEKEWIEEALSVMTHRENAIVAAGVLSMGEFMAAASWCSAAFTNDSGPMYVFDSRGVPTVAFFGPSNAKLHHPMGARSCALMSTDMPLTQDHVSHTIRDRSYRPIETISVEEAIRAGEWALGMQSSDRYSRHYILAE